ncbi:MAG: serine hydrolase domain-containing protein [Pseudomonadota bacterium]
MNRALLIALAALSVLAGCGQSEDAAAPAPPATTSSGAAGSGAPALTQSALDAMLTRYDVPGAAVASFAGCGEAEITVAGVADLETGAPIGATSVFEAASLSKAVFAYLVMQLVDEGVVDLDRPLAETFDYARIEDDASYALITPRMVLTHRTGLPNWVDSATPFAEQTAPIPFAAPPGTEFTYSGEAFQLLQAFVERETGRSLQQLFSERLGDVMPHSTYVRPLADGSAATRGYKRASAPETGRDMTSLTDTAMSASSLATTAGDFAAFVAHVCRGDGLAASTHEAMIRPQSPVPADGSALPTSWGLGWMTADIGGATFVGHDGSNDEYRALGGYVKETGEGIVILTNASTGGDLIEAFVQEGSQDAVVE